MPIIPGSDDPHWAAVMRNYQEEQFGFMATSHSRVTAMIDVPPPSVYIYVKPPPPPPKPKREPGCSHATFQTRLVAALFRGVDAPNVENRVGYSMDELRLHLQRQFRRGMTWKNAASNMSRRDTMICSSGYKTRRKCWHIDHIVPKRTFARNDFENAFALTNLRPLWSHENMKKGQVRVHLL